MQKITPALWFDGDAEEAMAFYTSIFPRSKVTDVVRFAEGGRGPVGSVMSAMFELDGQAFMAINGGPQHRFTPAVSLMVRCETQDEVDRTWEQLLAGGGRPVQCGWIEDRYGLSWQIVPSALFELLQDPDPDKVERTTRAMLGMVKLDIAALKAAHAGVAA